MQIQSIVTPIPKASAADLDATLASMPELLCSPDANRSALQRAMSGASNANGLAAALYPESCGSYYAAGLLLKRLVDPGSYQVDAGTLDEHCAVVGDLTVDGDLVVIRSLVVTGTLHVKGTLRDCGPDSRLVVLGDLRCRHLLSSGWILVGGTLQASGLIRGQYNDDVLEVMGDIEAAAVLSEEHAIEAGGEFHVQHRPAEEGAWGEDIFDEHEAPHRAELRAAFGEQALLELLGDIEADYRD